MKRQLDDFVGLTDERVKQAIDIRRVSLRIIRGCKRATLRSVRAAVDDAGATYNRHSVVIALSYRRKRLKQQTEVCDVRKSQIDAIYYMYTYV